MNDFEVGDTVEIVGARSGLRWNGTRLRITRILCEEVYGDIVYKHPQNVYTHSIGDNTMFFSDKLIKYQSARIKVGDYVEVILSHYKGIQYCINDISGDPHSTHGFTVMTGIISVPSSLDSSYKVGSKVAFYLKDLKRIDRPKPPKKIKILAEKGWGPA